MSTPINHDESSPCDVCEEVCWPECHVYLEIRQPVAVQHVDDDPECEHGRLVSDGCSECDRWAWADMQYDEERIARRAR
uniref:Uncharacterized protein n=1 Tax=viral metagenome TaxID=1070528 RepID=A0A6M3LV67_9ZZZZ